MQTGVVAAAKQVAPDAPVTAFGFNIAAFNLGYRVVLSSAAGLMEEAADECFDWVRR
jgi:DHA1 family inner membrane transport protein